METVREEARCPSCSRLLVLRSGPAVTPHFAHRPRQSCRIRPGRAPLTTLRLEQLTLFEMEIPPRRVPSPAGSTPSPAPIGIVKPPPRPAQRRRRRRAWLPRLLRWVRARARRA